jgi:hypothetical protein
MPFVQERTLPVDNSSTDGPAPQRRRPDRSTSTPSPKDIALLALQVGLSPLPPRQDGTKAPLADVEDPVEGWTWKPYQTTPATLDRIRKWYDQKRMTGAGLCTAFGGVELLEFDDWSTYERFKAAASEVGLGDLVVRIERGYLETTPGGGVHWLYRVDPVLPNMKLAERPDPENSQKRDVLIETRGIGGFVVLAPSYGAVHETGKPYVLVNGGLSSIETITADERDDLFELARSFDEMPCEEVKDAQPKSKPQSKGSWQEGVRPGDDFNARETWENIVEPLEWKKAKTKGVITYWRRPGKDKGISASTGKTKGFHVFTTSTCLKAGGNYSKFGLYCALKHQGNWDAAVKALAKLGYGTWIDERGEEHQNPRPAKERSRPADRNGPADGTDQGGPAGSGQEPRGERPAGDDRKRQLRPRFSNSTLSKPQDEKPKVTRVDAPTLVANLKVIAGEWPKRVEETLFVETRDYRPVHLITPGQFFAWIDRSADVFWTKGAGMITQERLFEHVRKFTAPQFDAIELYPHEPPQPGLYYMHPPCKPQRQRNVLDQYLDHFCPETKFDRELLRAAIMTPFAGVTPGARPAFRIEGPEIDLPQLGGRGVGKTTSVDLIAAPCGGLMELRETESFSEFVTRLLSEDGRTKRVIRVDNLKTLKLSWADLEAFITSQTISGRQLFRGEGRRPNTLTLFVTVNGGSLSKDMASRTVTIRLARPAPNPNWLHDAFAFVEEHRWELIAQILGTLSDEPGNITPESRWAEWESAVLGRVSFYEECQALIKARALELDADNQSACECEDHFASKLVEHGHDTNAQYIKLPLNILAEWLTSFSGKRVGPEWVTRTLNTKPLVRLKYQRTGTERFWAWIGGNADTSHDPVELGQGPIRNGAAY